MGAQPGSDPDEAASSGSSASASGLAAYRGLLRNRSYRLWFISSIGSSLGDWAGLFALQVLVVRLAEPGSRLALFGLGGIMMARLLPSVFFGPVAGVLADRYDRKRLMIATDMLRGVLFLGVAFSTDIVALLALTFLVECLSLLYIAAKDAALPTIVPREHLHQANQLNLFITYGPLPFGALAITAMTGLAVLLGNAVDPIRLALFVNAGTFLVAGPILLGMHLPAHGRRRMMSDSDEETSVLDEVKEGLAFIRDLPLVRSLILGVVGVFFGAGVIVTLGPELVRTTLGRSGTDWPTLMTFVGGGVLAGIVLAGPLGGLGERRPALSRERLFPVFLSATGGVAVATAILPTFGQVLVAGTLLGLLAGLSAVFGYTLLQVNTDDATRGRTFAAFYTGTRVSMFLALGLAPFLAGAIGRFSIGAAGRQVTMSGIRITILLGGVVALLSALSTWRGMYRALADEKRPHTTLTLPGEQAERRGVFIAFEGVEGAGKSTQIRRLAERLDAEGYDVLLTREPGGPPVAERIRDVLLDSEAMHARTEALLYAAARAEHVERVIAPALRAGKVVLCDRFLDSSLAYQGYARALGADDVEAINRWGTGGLVPDVVVLLHLDPRDGLDRARARAARRTPDREAGAVPLHPERGLDRIEREDLPFHLRVAEGYLELARRRGRHFVVVDAGAEQSAVARQVRSGLHTWLPLPVDDRGADDPSRVDTA